MALDIDEKFFKNYAGSGRAYARVWRQYCYFDECTALFKDPQAPTLKSICVLGTATGEICEAFYKKFGVKPYGCEVSRWAHRQTKDEFRSRVRCRDMRDYVSDIVESGKRFTLVFSNSLIYLPEADVPKILRELSRCTDFLHCRSSTSGSKCPDPWRQTLRPYAWWNEQISRAGFRVVPGAKGQRTYLWQSLWA
ncbi:MAG TPA: class I SAM-dependent methyltransferase [Bdellovibrionota bacterium]|jgi:hypothetical protein|nr:class I SAM-dependent methyltransferase [Bdellovibrionota bacterium]